MKRRQQAGFTMIELMIALTIGLFLMGGLLTLLQNNRRTFDSQGKLAVLQDSQRLAFTMLTDVIQEAGYFPDPTLYTAAGTLLAGTPSGAPNAMAVGQAITGAASGTAQGDIITVRYTTASGDGILNCNGTANASGANTTYSNTFKVTAANQLVCVLQTGVTYLLVNNVTSLQILYGVDASSASPGADTYMTAAQVVAAAAWTSVISVRLAVTFTNPLFVSGGVGQPATITLTRVVGVMNQTG
jgi:type IV pilus assembly protein PilW